MSSFIPEINFDEHLARFLLMTMVFTIVLTGFEVLGAVIGAAFLSIAVLTIYTAIQGFRYGYLEGKLKASKYNDL